MRIRMPTDRDSGELKGFAYIEFESADAKTKAAEYDGSEACGGYLKVWMCCAVLCCVGTHECMLVVADTAGLRRRGAILKMPCCTIGSATAAEFGSVKKAWLWVGVVEFFGADTSVCDGSAFNSSGCTAPHHTLQVCLSDVRSGYAPLLLCHRWTSTLHPGRQAVASTAAGVVAAAAAVVVSAAGVVAAASAGAMAAGAAAGALVAAAGVTAAVAGAALAGGGVAGAVAAAA
jgi:hypothetical protein